MIAWSLWEMTGWTPDLGATIVVISVIQGFGFGLVFIPLSGGVPDAARPELRTDGTSMLTLVRNIASSIGISVVIAQLTSGTREAHAMLAEHINPFNDALQMPNVTGTIDMATTTGRAMLDVMVTMQAQIIAFSHDYQLVMVSPRWRCRWR